MKTAIESKFSNRAAAFKLWMKSPMPMVTLTKTLDVTCLVKFSHKRGLKFNMLLCWCIGQAAKRIEEFYTLPEGDKLFWYDRLAINTIVTNIQGGINSCDIPLFCDLNSFNMEYLNRTQRAKNDCESCFVEGCMVIGTSAMIQTELDAIVNQYTDKFSNPMVMWGKYRKYWFKTALPISFQFHHVQMDGGHAALFLDELQKEINKYNK